jgi:Domain of unknown function (DUF6265)
MKLIVFISIFLASTWSYAQEFSFMRGCWQNTFEGRLIEECWASPDGGLILGTAKETIKGKLVSFEFLKIEKKGFSYTLTGYPSGIEGPTYTLRSLSSTSVVFTNTTGSFPTTISYSVIDTTMSVALEGEQNGSPLHIEYKLKKNFRW